MHKQRPAVEKLTIVYDGECRLCLASVDRLSRLGSRAELSFVPLQELERHQNPKGLQDKSDQQLREAIHVVDGAGGIYAGSDAIVRILRTVPGFGAAAWLYRLPGMERLGNAVYRYIAKRRYDWFGKIDESCSDASCRIPRDTQDNQP